MSARRRPGLGPGIERVDVNRSKQFAGPGHVLPRPAGLFARQLVDVEQTRLGLGVREVGARPVARPVSSPPPPPYRMSLTRPSRWQEKNLRPGPLCQHARDTGAPWN